MKIKPNFAGTGSGIVAGIAIQVQNQKQTTRGLSPSIETI